MRPPQSRLPRHCTFVNMRAAGTFPAQNGLWRATGVLLGDGASVSASILHVLCMHICACACDNRDSFLLTGSI